MGFFLLIVEINYNAIAFLNDIWNREVFFPIISFICKPLEVDKQ
jgi:hypothetical protein